MAVMEVATVNVEVNIIMKKNNNGSFRMEHVGKSVLLHGWIQRKRNLGGVLFLDLRDRSGIIQLVVRPEVQDYELASSLKNESVIEVEGTIAERESKNPHIKTGDIEVIVNRLTVLSLASDLPFEISSSTTALEETRLKYRYLDLRREPLRHNLIMRSKITTSIREYLVQHDFLEIETPILCKSTPEGARDYLVPSRVSKGKFYALPQSPQMFKQLLMIGGMERYFQVARCFRDEDLRADRQPEFTQVDIEMSFVNEEDIQTLTEELLKKVFYDTLGMKIETPFLRMKYDDALSLYGSDKPDMRFEMLLHDVTDLFAHSTFTVFQDTISKQGTIMGMVLKGKAKDVSRKTIDTYTEYVKRYGAHGLAFVKYEEGIFTGGISKFLSDEEREALIKTLSLEDNDVLFFISDKKHVAQVSLGELRLKVARDFDLIDQTQFKFLWVTEFPLFEYSEEDGRYYACHHPFTSPRKEDVDRLLSAPGECYARAYDVVLNGYELGGGSIRIHEPDVQTKMFQALSLSEEDIKEKFGFFVQAFQYGTPPHGGLAIGLERLVMLVCGTENMKDVVAFPKTASASCLMSEAPNTVELSQLEDLAIQVVASEKENED